MNLMFYDFNGSSREQNSTGTNFYQSNGGGRGGGPGENAPAMPSTNGDRLPTRERGYRSANQYVRRRVAMPAGINNGLIANGPPQDALQDCSGLHPKGDGPSPDV